MRYRALIVSLALLATPNASHAQQLDDETQRMLQCGAQFRYAAEHEDFEGSDANRASMRDFGNFLLNKADQNLIDSGMSEDDRERLGFDTMQQTMAAFETDTLPVDADTCFEMVDQLMGADNAGGSDENTARIDMLLTCGAGFYASSIQLREGGEVEDADFLEELGVAQISAADDLMVAAGMSDNDRFEISKLYGEIVGEKLQNGEELDYDWDTCAQLEF